MKTTCNKSWPVNLASDNILWILYLFTTEVVPKIFPNLNIVAHFVAPGGWGSCLSRLAILYLSQTQFETFGEWQFNGYFIFESNSV